MESTVRERTFPASLDCLGDFRAFILEEDGAEERLPPKRVAHLDVAIEEIVVNICSYAYETPPGELNIRVEESPEAFAVEFLDNGVAFDPLAVDEPDVTRPLEERDAGGLGILLVRRMMDEVHYSRKGALNSLRIVVKTPRER
jgi:anti-sigma regulatory factor (Ser/Thr protein kinase)